MENTLFVLGAGSLGLLYAARMARTGRSVTLLVKPEQAAVLGLGVTLQEGEAALPRRLFMRVISQPTPELQISRLLLATKATQAATALQRWLPHLAADAEVLMLQNGLGSQAEVADLLLSGQTLLAASVTEGAYLKQPGAVIHAGKGKTLLGRWSGPSHQASSGWISRLTAAGLDAELVEPIRPVLWHKLAVNAVINPLTAVHRVENGALSGRDFRPQVQVLCEELLQVFRRIGIAEPAGGLTARIEQVILSTAANRSSMLQDIEAGRVTEIDYITGTLLKVARSLELQLPTHETLYQQVKQAELH